MASSNNKQYGLIIPKKFNINEVKRAAVFNNESDSDDSAEAGTSDWIKKSFQKQAAAQTGGLRRQTEIDMKKALAQDPTVYKYDEIYDDLEKKKAEEDKKKKTDTTKPRYIQNLLKAAQQRKLENERRIERQVQKDREAEGEQYKDKETFVTSAYKKKLEEFQKFDEEERKRDMLEEICDVSKQQDLSGFYRHLYKATVDKDESEKKEPDLKNDNVDEKEKESVTEVKKNQRENRQYRKRKTSESSSLEEGERNSDSDTSIDSSSSSDVSTSSKSTTSKKIKCDNSEPQNELIKNTEMESSKSDVTEEINSVKCLQKEDSNIDENNHKEKNIEHKHDDNENPVQEEKVKINIWVKRTVGPVFEAALERYFKRKAERLSGQ